MAYFTRRGRHVNRQEDRQLLRELFRNNWNWHNYYNGTNILYSVQTGDWTGTNWSPAAPCFGLPVNGWHFDVWRGAYLYYMVGCDKTDPQGGRLWLAQSRDATNWTVLSTDAIAPPPMAGQNALGDPLNVVERSTKYYTPKVVPRLERRVDLYVSYLSVCVTNGVVLKPTAPEPTAAELGPNGAGLWNSNGWVYLYLSADGKTITSRKLLAP